MTDSILILECDKNQHKGYSKYGEAAREITLMEGCGGRPLVLVRYNPDNLCTPNTSSPEAGTLVVNTRENTVAKIIVDFLSLFNICAPREVQVVLKLQLCH